MAKGIFVISLDFELAWGFHDSKKAAGPYKKNILGARLIVPKLLELFARYDIHVTWATVGALGCESKTELIQLSNPDLVYTKNNHSLDKYIEQNVGHDEKDDPLHYANSLIDLIKNQANQRIATHTFSHFYLLDQTLANNDFDQDLAAVKVIFPKVFTIVLPRNQVSAEGLKSLRQAGLRAYRGTQQNKCILPLYRTRASGKQSTILRALKFMDYYLPLTGYYDYGLNELDGDGLLNIRASSFLRPYLPMLSFFEALKVKRIKQGMEQAAKNNTIYHLWWHPHNNGVNQKENLALIETILKYYRELKQRYGMESMSMEELCELSESKPRTSS
ncbi:MAG: hypothetical protein P4L69_09560 [Desulfosporosinus sp.]|nr:hypothetical protein [Desulfosporosinus sp.]